MIRTPADPWHVLGVQVVCASSNLQMAINAHKTIVVHEVLDTVGYHGELSGMFFH